MNVQVGAPRRRTKSSDRDPAGLLQQPQPLLNLARKAQHIADGPYAVLVAPKFSGERVDHLEVRVWQFLYAAVQPRALNPPFILFASKLTVFHLFVALPSVASFRTSGSARRTTSHLADTAPLPTTPIAPLAQGTAAARQDATGSGRQEGATSPTQPSRVRRHTWKAASLPAKFR